MSIEWDDSLATGIEEIDSQHREIFNRFGKLYSACSAGKGRDEVLQLLDFLHEYVKSHFSAEEKLQFRHGYPEQAGHRQLHQRFMQDVERLERSFKSEGATLALVIQTNQTLTSWLIQHISKADMEFTRYLKQQG